MIYVDHAATSPLRRDVLEAMWPYLTSSYGNPSSTHELGRQARLGVEHARSQVAEALNCSPSEIVFTSGGTEADNLAIIGLSLADPRGRHVITTPVEHKAVLEAGTALEQLHEFRVSYVPVDELGMVDVDALESELAPDTTLCSIIYANNEIGTVQRIARISAVCRAKGVPLHIDAVQAPGLLTLDVEALGVDAMSLSAHKFGGPKGIGALYIRSTLRPDPTVHGGGQERGLRSGTENVASIVGLGAALAAVTAERTDATAHLVGLRDRLIEGVLRDVVGASLTGSSVDRLPNHASFCVAGTFGESVLVELEELGIVCSSGSACAAGSDEVSHVLTAIGVEHDLARTALRFTLGSTISDDEIDAIIAAIPQAVERVRSLG